MCSLCGRHLLLVSEAVKHRIGDIITVAAMTGLRKRDLFALEWSDVMRRAAEWSILYAWCPLVMKEFANSGHLDSIAVFFSVATFYCAVRSFYPRRSENSQNASLSSAWSDRTWTLLAALLLSLAVGAKIYPIVLAPLLFLSARRKVSRMAAVSAGIVVLTLTAMMISPMLSRDRLQQAEAADLVEESPPLPPLPPIPTPPDTTSSSKPPTPHVDPAATGLSAFAGQWEMNDFLFRLLSENFRDRIDGPRAWFVVTTPSRRHHFVGSVAASTSLRPSQVPFLAARLLTGVVFIVVAMWFAWRGMKSADPHVWLRSLFLTIA